MVRPIVLVICALAASGCSELLSDPELPKCPGGTAAPLTSAEVATALREEGFSVYEDDEGCDGAEDKAIELTNILFSGPHENISEHAEIGATEGYVGCGVGRKPLFGNQLDSDLDAPPASPFFSGDKAEFLLANIQCTIYPEGDDKAGQVERLRRALEKLEATL
jgi:hypothetical protein